MANVTISKSMNDKLTSVVISSKELHFSYETLVAFGHAGHPLVVCENVWGPTTGKHLNAIDGGRKERRVSRDDFLRLLNSFEQED